MLDKSIPYREIWMVRSKEEPVPAINLPEGFHFAFYQEGDEAEWAKIETSVFEFSDEEEALDYFSRAFAPFPQALSQRMLFIEDETGEKTATCTAWWKEVDGKTKPLLHWLAVKPKFQKRGLAAALAAGVTVRLAELEPNEDIYLHTQTWSHPAVKLYERLGYKIVPENIDGSKNEDYQEALEIINQLQQKKTE
ncbi:GNAT family N-acetyltransferase [Enterococcus sp. LJL128]